MELITKSFANQCLAFPSRVDAMLATITTVEAAKDMLDKAAAMNAYAKSLKAGIEIERPIAIGVLKIKAKIGELMPAEKGGRGKKLLKQVEEFSAQTMSAYRKLAANADKLDEYYEAVEDVPTQNDFIRYCGSDNVICSKHNNNVVDWYTPEKHIGLARDVMGDFDCDPASSVTAQKIVKAKTFYTAAQDGLSKEWAGVVWLNPPFKMPLIEQFVFKLIESVESKAVSQAILLTNNNTDTKWWQAATKASRAVCFTAGRIRFYNQAGEFSSPTNGQTFFYFGKREKKFSELFSNVGVVLCQA